MHRFLSVLTVAAVAVAAIFGGQRYFYCRAMDRIMAPTTCCARMAQSPTEGAAVGELNDCFEVRFLKRLVSFTVGSELAVPPAAVSAMLPTSSRAPLPASAMLVGVAHPIRAGPVSPSVARARLMVFLI